MSLSSLGLNSHLLGIHGVANIMNAPYTAISANVVVNESQCFYIQAQKWISCVYSFNINTSDANPFTITLSLPIAPTYTVSTLNEIPGVSFSTNGLATSSLTNILRLSGSSPQISMASTFAGQQNIVAYLIYSYN